MSTKIANRVVLAYSGGLDTSVAIKWLLEHKCNEVICVAIDLGQGAELGPIQAKALKIGAAKSEIIDARQEFIDKFCFQALKANAKYDRAYPLATAIARPLIAKILVDIARKYQADAIAHGCTGKGNDQVRFDLSIMTLAPEMSIIAPAREWGMSREDCINYAERHSIPIPITKANPFSVDLNLWGRSAECGILEDLSKEPPEEAYGITANPLNAPNEPEYLSIEFERGVPVKLNEQAMDSISLVEVVNKIAGKHGVGRIDQVENRVIGIKSREIYESPAAVILSLAHDDLEYLTMTKDMKHFKACIDQKYSELIYNGRWFSPLKTALDAFLDQSQANVSGSIGLKLYKGSATIVTRKSKYSLYDHGLATYDRGDKFNHQAALGFIELFGLDMKTHAIVSERDLVRNS
jgi:argininosuccinate synthase